MPPEFPLVPLHVLQKGGEGTPYAIGQYSFRYLSDTGELLLNRSGIFSFYRFLITGFVVLYIQIIELLSVKKDDGKNSD